jgi:hypothetical protein
MTDAEPPPIPVRLADRPTIGGLVVPWVTGRSPDGRYRFGAIDATRHRDAIQNRRCQTCGGRLDRDRIVFAMRDADLRRMVSPEAGMHPDCGRYSATACPMLAGRMTHHRRHPGIAHVAGAEYLGDPDDARSGAPAQPWHLVWVDGYRPITDSRSDTPAALLLPDNLLRIRPIATPPA